MRYRKLMGAAALALLAQGMTAHADEAAMPKLDARDLAERDLLKRAVEIPTVAGRGQMPRMTAMLSAELRKAGITDIAIKPYDDTQALIARLHAPSSTAKPIIVMAHMDVVEAKASDWIYDPFKFREEKGYYLGRGVSDNKAGLVAMIAALQRLKASGFVPRRDIVVLLTGDEETQQKGALLASTEWKPLIDAEYALNSDGGGGSVLAGGLKPAFAIQVAEKVYADFTFTATNRGGHSSRPRADNAIYQLAGALKALEDWRFTPHLDAITRPGWEHEARTDGGLWGAVVQAWLDEPDNAERADAIERLGPGSTRTRCVATMLSGGHAPNALPQKATANINCRIFPTESIEETQAVLKRIAGPDVTVTRGGDGGLPSPPSPLRDDVMGAVTRSIRTRWPDAAVIPEMSAGATDGSYLRSAGIPTYGVSGLYSVVGELGGAHGLNEKVRADAFHDEVDHWERLLRELAG